MGRYALGRSLLEVQPDVNGTTLGNTLFALRPLLKVDSRDNIFTPTRGFFAAFDAMTGREDWRFYTVPGDPSKPFENGAMKNAAATWDGEWWKLGGGGSVWDGLAYDPDRNRWSPLPQAPLLGRTDPTAAWTGTQLIVWGGEKPGQNVASAFYDGAAFTPAR